MSTPVIHNVEPFDWSNTTTHYSKYDANGLSQIIQFGPGSPALWTMRNNGSNYLGLNVPSSATQGAACIINGTVFDVARKPRGTHVSQSAGQASSGEPAAVLEQRRQR